MKSVIQKNQVYLFPETNEEKILFHNLIKDCKIGTELKIKYCRNEDCTDQKHDGYLWWEL